MHSLRRVAGTLSRLVHDGGGHRRWRLPVRRGRLFDPDCYPFLEGRPCESKRGHEEKLTPPKVSDGVLYRVLEDLLYLEGEHDFFPIAQPVRRGLGELATFAKDHPFTFLDHSFRGGDSLVGLSFDQIVDALGEKGNTINQLQDLRRRLSARQRRNSR